MNPRRRRTGRSRCTRRVCGQTEEADVQVWVCGRGYPCTHAPIVPPWPRIHQGPLDDARAQGLTTLGRPASVLRPHDLSVEADGEMINASTEAVRVHLPNVTDSARKIRARLQPLLDTHGDHVHVRPSSTGIAMVGLNDSAARRCRQWRAQQPPTARSQVHRHATMSILGARGGMWTRRCPMAPCVQRTAPPGTRTTTLLVSG